MGGWIAGVATIVVAGLLLTLAAAIGRRITRTRSAKRQPRWRSQPRVDRTGLSVHLKMVWLSPVDALDARLTPVRPVRQTSSGGSSRQVLRQGDSIEAVFGWDEASKPATATLEWREQGSPKDYSETLDLAQMAKPA